MARSNNLENLGQPRKSFKGTRQLYNASIIPNFPGRCPKR